MKTNKIISASRLKRKLPALRRKGKTIAFTNGCFDILHYGHVSYLQKAKGRNRVLVIGLNNDLSVKTIKGRRRPIVPQGHRARILAALECVDYVILFGDKTPIKLIKMLMPDVLIKGADYRTKEVVGADVVKKNGGKVEFIPFVKGSSTSGIIKTVIDKCRI